MRDVLAWALPLLVSLFLIQSAADALYSRAAEVQAMDDVGEPPRDTM